MLLHDEVVFNTNGTLSMVPKHPLVWNEELSMGNREDDVFMLPNIALLVSFFHFLCCNKIQDTMLYIHVYSVNIPMHL